MRTIAKAAVSDGLIRDACEVETDGDDVSIHHLSGDADEPHPLFIRTLTMPAELWRRLVEQAARTMEKGCM